MKAVIFTLLCLTFSTELLARVFQSAPPAGLLLKQEKQFEGTPIFGEHGLEQYCFSIGNSYVTYERNTVGEGYSFNTVKPFSSCQTKGELTRASNQLGLKVGLTAKEASNLLGFTLKEGKNSFVWQFQREIDNILFDDQTTLDIVVQSDIVIIVSLFSTVTN